MASLYGDLLVKQVLIKPLTSVYNCEKFLLNLSIIFSVAVSALDAKATGWPSCNRAAPRPDCDVSHCRVTSFETSQ